ncbi:unnamed protein product [Camellia sinensis]
MKCAEEIPDEGEMDADVDMSRAEDDDLNSKDLEDMKKALKEIEEEAGALREMQSKVEKEMGTVQVRIMAYRSASMAYRRGGNICADALAKLGANQPAELLIVNDSPSEIRRLCEEVQQHFQSCGTINRVTILTDKFGQPEGFAYVEFVEIEAFQNALLLNESELHGC